MNFRTQIEAEHYPFTLNYHQKLMFIGSCFSDHIGQKLNDSAFNVRVNPFGVLYNPISVANALDICLDQREFSEVDLIQHDGLFHSFYHHGKFSSNSAKETLEAINKTSQEQARFLQEVDYLFLTFGTAYVYRYIEKDLVVSNCHKLPARDFKHDLLDVEIIVDVYNSLINKLLKVNPNLKIVVTVSPVRHWKNGAHNDQISKATLLLAIHQLENRLKVFNYYPSYELLMDDLRDYRFYKDDMLHPNSMAIDYVYEHFKSSFFDDETSKLEQRVLKLKQALNHRAINPNSEAHRKFIILTQQKIRNLLTQYPYINQEILNYED